MSELQPPETQLNGVGGGPLVVATSETVGSKRQRRPSVRLGDIGGDQHYDSHMRRASSKQWKHHNLSLDHHHNNKKDPSGKSSKTRPLMNLSNETLEEDKEVNLDTVAIGSWRVKDSKKRGSVATKRVRSNWVSKIDDGGGGCIGGNNGEGEEKYSGGEDIDDGYRDYDVENSESPEREQSPIHSLDNELGDGNERDVLYNNNNNRRQIRGREQHHQDGGGVELSGPSDNGGRCGEDGVRIWLNSLGLGRYAPVFEIHEVDDEVLPMLTLEDLKDMGINAVGSRRKMYCAIQKLGKGFS